ncbi:hypothetical protein JVU11DRAFT_6344 [Chiua virens]|nr:hypothetical protein JVU11DRAFT_6344 [Chiua virens]
MATNLYEILGISRNATSEQVRKAYRRKALETHPDRLPQGASAAEKAASEDMFRKVNNAYEVLSDSQNRATYDQYGVWPAPMPTPQGPFTNGANGGAHDPFSGPFFGAPFSRDPFSRAPRMDPFDSFGAFGSRPAPSRGFTDPFVLFNAIFGDLHRAFESESFFNEEPFGRRGFGSGGPFGGGFFNHGFPSVMPSPFDFGGGGMGSSSRMQGFGDGNGGRWASESWSSSTVNGVTHTKCVRRDSEGNEHVTHRYPDGTERRTINGIEQSASQPQRALPPSAPPAPPVSYPTRADSMPPPPPYSEAVAQSPHRSRSSRRYTTYDDYSGDRRDHRDEPRHDYTPRDHRHGYDGQGHDTQSTSSRKFWKA